jgi:hypothetical protein
MKVTEKAVVLLAFTSQCQALVPFISPSFTQQNVRYDSTLFATNEKGVRQELKEKSLSISAEDEIKYGSTNPDDAISSSPSDTNGDKHSPDMEYSSLLKTSFMKKMERLTKPRAYPLFLAEKGVIIAEQFFDSVFHSREKEFTKSNEKKERLVILGTGWGAAAFLKDIDVDKYDVTVVSPRNHFLFTPMLAGASVGTVEFRSITESIRQVGFIVF